MKANICVTPVSCINLFTFWIWCFCVWRRVPGKRCDFFSMHFCVDRLTVLALWQSSINVSRCALKARWAGMPCAAFPVFLNLTCACYTFVHHSCNWQRAGGNFNGRRVACAIVRVLLLLPWRSHDSRRLQHTSKLWTDCNEMLIIGQGGAMEGWCLEPGGAFAFAPSKPGALITMQPTMLRKLLILLPIYAIWQVFWFAVL